MEDHFSIRSCAFITRLLLVGLAFSGIYTAKITDKTSQAYFHITFIVRDALQTRKQIALLASTNTWQAYNFWPGQNSSLYIGHRKCMTP